MEFAEQQRHWDAFAHLDPRWAVLSDPRKRGGRWGREEFYATGQEVVARALEGVGPLERALDVGCGPGRNTKALRDHCEEVVGYDISPQMLELAREGAREGETYVLNETDDLAPFADESFDLVFCHLVLQHIDASRQGVYLAEFARVLRPGGRLSLQMISHLSGLPGSGESGPDPSWAWEGTRPYYEVNAVPIWAMTEALIRGGFAIERVTETPTEGQSMHSFDYLARC